MCRMVGMLSATPATPAWGLFDAPRSLAAQSCARPSALQRDGWGLGWYRDARPQWFRSPAALYDEPQRLKQVAGRAVTRLAIGHVREASNPLRLPRRELIRIENTQPFAFRRHLFAHNGTLNIPREVRETLGLYRDHVKGVNDSEVLFWLLVGFLEEGLDFRRAIRCTIRQINTVWKSLRRPADQDPFTGLNLLHTDGDTLHAVCHSARPAKRRVDSLCTKEWPRAQMAWRLDRGVLWIASEPLDGGRWQKLERGRILTARMERGQIRVRVSRI